MEELQRAMKSAKSQIIIDAILLVVWAVILIVRLVNDIADTFRIVLYSICIIAFLVSMIINIIRFRKLKKELQEVQGREQVQ